jgi:hypothetical protein
MRYMPNRSRFQQLTFMATVNPNIPNTLDKYHNIAPYSVSSKNEADLVGFMVVQKFIGEYGAFIGDQSYDGIGGNWWPNQWFAKNTLHAAVYGAPAIDVDMEGSGSSSTEYFRILVAVNSVTGNGYFVSLQRGLFTVCPLWHFNGTGIALGTDVKPGAGLPAAGTGWGGTEGYRGVHETTAADPFVMDTNGIFVLPSYVDLLLNKEDIS